MKKRTSFGSNGKAMSDVLSSDLTEKLLLARGLLSDVRYSVSVRKEQCRTCGSQRYDNFNVYQMRESCQGAISRIDKAIEHISKEGDNEPQTSRTNRNNTDRG